MTPKEVLIAAKALIDTEDKWCQLAPEWDDRRCALRALDVAAVPTSKGTWRHAEELLHAAIPHRFVARAMQCGHFEERDRIAEYNDCRTHRGVMRWFDRAIEAAS